MTYRPFNSSTKPIESPSTVFEKGEWTVANKGSSGEQRKPKKGEAPYNQHMKKTIKKIKEENPGIHHRDAFCRAAELWKTSPENPKNKAKSKGGSSSSAGASSSRR